MKQVTFSLDEILGKTNRTYESKSPVGLGLSMRYTPNVIVNVSLGPRIAAAVDRASSKVAILLKEALDEAMKSPVWGGQDKNIYDTGALMRSGRVIVDGSGLRVVYDEDYAALVHYGGYIVPYGNINARVYLPPKPWVDSVLFGGGPVAPFDLAGVYEQEIRKVLGL